MKINNIHTWFWISAFIIFIAGLFTYSDENAAIDINIHDTYYIIHLFHLITLIAFLYFVVGCIYWSFNKMSFKLFNTLNRIHLVCSIGGLFLYFVLMYVLEDDTEIEPGVFNETSLLGYALIILTSIILFSQLIFIINLLISLIKKLTS